MVTSTKSAGAGKKGLSASSLNRQQVNSINNSFSKLVKLKPASSHKRLRKSTSKSRKREE